MDVCVKQEKLETNFECEQENGSAPWEVYGSWVKTGDIVPSSELIIPLTKRSRYVDLKPYDDDLNRAKREFVPDEKKDLHYWNKRIKNNASARRSRLKKKVIEKNMEARLQELQRENIELKYELAALRRHFADKLETKQPYEEVVSDGRSDLSMRTGSGSDSSDSGSVTSEGDNINGSYDTEKVLSPHLSVLASTTSRSLSPNMFPYSNWAIPFKYSFMQCPVVEKGNNSVSTDGDLEVLTKIPHKFRHKKDFHSAFYVQPFTAGNA